MSSLQNKVALITGGSKGIGLGIAQALAAEGVKVAVTSRSQSSADAGAKEVSNDALGIEADVRNRASMDAAVKATVDRFGKIDFLIANAGLGHFASIENLTDEQWHDTIDTNLTGVFHTIRAGLDELKKSKGYIITISSLAGTNFFPTASAYNASKFGLTGFTQAVMLDLRHHGINVSTIMPGSVTSHFNGHTPSEEDAWKIQPEDIGELCVDLFKMNPRALPSKVEVRPARPPQK
ncbi:SDR family oxidoreductase [Phaeocystidibacter luteus]|uniref:SDR family oxidoreductase n=1 Tax=Phaeocystidibacter luteus TaxID=911197 RepID=A0A6N6REW2_9FLAO|nr:SDR family oxidoreductase [Phaeocystidibacter luteus]KAB2808706.1 SDR family oxidoreductase [Phaeocystidibacter luteus]